MNSIRTLLAAAVDYAGLFPPAGLDMASTVMNYARYRRGAHPWALGRLIVPVTRLAEFEEVLTQSARSSDDTWQVSVLLGQSVESETEAVLRFNELHAGDVVIDSVEAKASQPDMISDLCKSVPSQMACYVEIPIGESLEESLAALHESGARAKVRTGGVAETMFPTGKDLTRFLAACVQAKTPFKATAGLHHPIRGTYRLTYEKSSSSSTMFGFLNLMLASGLLAHGVDPAEARQVLEERSVDAFVFEDEQIRWGAHTLSSSQLQEVRRTVAMSFGSCSFTEPIDDLIALGLL